MQEIIGFNWQDKRNGQCGQYAFTHALLVLGIPVSIREAHRLQKWPIWKTSDIGTDEEKIKRGLKKCNCKAIEYTVYDDQEAKKIVDDLLNQDCPVIICTNNYNHWAVIAGKMGKNKYIWIDSSDDDLIGSWKWQDIADWIACENDDGSFEYYILGVKPKDKNYKNHSLVSKFNKVWDLLADPDLCEWWGYYMEDLLEVFDCDYSAKERVTADEFFKLYKKKIVETINYFYPGPDKKYIEYEINNYEKVAKAYNLFVSKDKIPEALISFTSALTLVIVYEYQE